MWQCEERLWMIFAGTICKNEDKKILRYKVEESEYHSFDENQKGTIAIVNDNYYGFCVNEDE